MSKRARSESEKPFALCQQCEKKFESPHWKRAKFCSLRCFGQSKMLPKRPCVDCGKTLSWGAESRCMKCRGVYLRKVRMNGDWFPCRTCGKLIYRNPSHMRGSPRTFGVFCDQGCFGKFMTGPNNPAYLHGQAPNPYPPKFKFVKKKVLERDGRVCFVCWKKGEYSITGRRYFSLDVHHIDGNARSTDIWNLVTLCKKCHRKQENPIAAKRLSLLLKIRYQDRSSFTT